MRIPISRLKLFSGLMMLAVSTTACGSEQSQEMVQKTSESGAAVAAVDPDSCKQLNKYKGSDHTVEILVDEYGGVSIRPPSYTNFWHKDSLSWRVVSSPWMGYRKDKTGKKDVKSFEIQFVKEGFCETETRPPKAWPCKGNDWERNNGKVTETNTNKPITCKIRNDALKQETNSPHPHPQNNPAKEVWQYCYGVQVEFNDGTFQNFGSNDILAHDVTGPGGGGGGCSNCHADTSL